MQAQHTADSILAAIQAGELTKGPIVEVYVRTGRKDAKGREIAFARGHCEVIGTGHCYGWVQNARCVKGDFQDFGATQPWKLFNSKAEALSWTLRTANERIAKLA